MAERVPLVSVIIPSYNHAKFLPDAIESIQKQTYPSIEIIVVDDGSTDNTRAVISQFSEVNYVYQNNQGLSAARNTGVKNSAGAFLIFADADDLLFAHAIAYNIQLLEANPSAAFVSGGYDLVDVDTKEIKKIGKEISSDHYLHLLKENYIGMHGTVLYRRWVFDEFQFDVGLKACEDYDLYLRVARKYPVLHHRESIACYRMHSTNLSGNATLMLLQSLQVLERQKSQVSSKAEKAAWQQGMKTWIEYYSHLIYCAVRGRTAKSQAESLKILKKYKPKLYFRHLMATYYDKIITKNSA